MADNPLQPGSYTLNHVTDNERQYRSKSCDWSAKGKEGNEVSLPKHFDSGKVGCSPRNANKEIMGIGDRAWSEFQKYFGMGTLRVCSATAMLEVKVDLTSQDEATAKAIAQKICGAGPLVAVKAVGGRRSGISTIVACPPRTRRTSTDHPPA